VHPAFAIPVFDGPNTLVTAGFDDFGVVGAIGYPLILAAIYIVIRQITANRLPPFLYYLVAFRLIYQLLYVEQGLSAMLTVGLRDLAIITITFLFLWKLSRIRVFTSLRPH
jgi:hypothetical protein